MIRRLKTIAAVVIGTAALISTSSAQPTLPRRGRRLVEPPPDNEPGYDGGFRFCRVMFDNAPDGDGNGWYVDYPRADLNLSFRLGELTTTEVSHGADGDPAHVLLRLTDPELFRCPFVMMTEPGGAYFSPEEAARLREYLLKGGFLWVDDFWGEYAWNAWVGQLRKALPAPEYPIVDLSLDHPLFHTVYAVRRVPQIPSIGFWLDTGGQTSERGADSAEAHARVLTDSRGRVLVLMTHNTDFGDAFERETDDRNYFQAFADVGYAFGIDALVYAMSH